MQIRDRVLELRRVPASELIRNPDNWRRHGKAQVDALRGLLTEIGFAGAELAFPADGLGPNGDFSQLMLIDGHARRELAGDEALPVLVTDLTLDEARKVLATFDPIASMAEADTGKLDALLRDVATDDQAVRQMLDSLADQHGIGDGDGETELRQLDVKPPPKMSWVLIGIPTVRFGEISEAVEMVAACEGVIVETTVNDG